MSKNTKIILAVTAVVLIIVIIVSFVIQPKNTVNKEPVISTPQRIVIPTRGVEDNSTQTGAIYISPTENEYTEITLIANLRNSCPITNSAFSMDYDYDKNKFIVVIKDPSDTNSKLYTKWMSDTGYDQISPIYFEIR